jgi:serine protease
VSWMADSDGIGDGQVFEGANVPGAKNVFDWPYMNVGSAQDIGVARAWQLLQSEGKLAAKVRILVNDGGFIPNADSAETWTIDYMDFNESNPMTCTNGTPCPWHGTYVIAAAMAEADNDFGVAGPAGPLASDVIAVGNGGDAWTRFRRTARETEEHHARIVNMSWSHTAHIFKDAKAYSTDRHLRHMNEAGALVFAAAGNNSRDVDDDALILPCESSRAICVGGMGWNSALLHSFSNYGSEADSTSVDIYGPMCTWALNDPSNPADTGIKALCGTSISSPFVAGVAALVMAADPTLDYKQVEAILMSTAHSGGLSNGWWQGNDRRVNAAKAVAKALRSGPSVEITAPGDKSQHFIASSFGFTADVADYHGDQLPVQWSSSISGKLGPPKTGIVAWGSLPVGKHVISATAVDSFGDSTTNQITIDVVDEKADVSIVAPVANSSHNAGTAITLIGNTFDPDTGGQVPNGSAKWVVKRNGSKVYEATGHEVSLPAAKVVAGGFVAEFSADGTTVSRPFKVVALPPGQTVPTATITSPAQTVRLVSQNSDPFELTLAGSGTDKEDGAIPGTSYRWTATSQYETKVLCVGSGVPGQGKPGQVQVFNNCSSVDVELDYYGMGDAIWSVKLEVFDSAGNKGVDDVIVKLSILVG